MLHTDGINVLVQCNAIIYALIVSRLQIFSHLPIARHDESMYERKSTQSAFKRAQKASTCLCTSNAIIYAMYALTLVRLPIFCLLPNKNMNQVFKRVQLLRVFLTRTEGINQLTGG